GGESSLVAWLLDSTWTSSFPLLSILVLQFIICKISPIFNSCNPSALSFQTTMGTAPDSSASEERSTLPGRSSLPNLYVLGSAWTIPTTLIELSCCPRSPIFVNNSLNSGNSDICRPCGSISTLLRSPACTSASPVNPCLVYACPILRIRPCKLPALSATSTCLSHNAHLAFPL